MIVISEKILYFLFALFLEKLYHLFRANCKSDVRQGTRLNIDFIDKSIRFHKLNRAKAIDYTQKLDEYRIHTVTLLFMYM